MFNLFHRSDEPAIICVVRDDARLPRFLRGPNWEYEGKAGTLTGATAALDMHAEVRMSKQTGYYLFTRL
ncbi:hypothetical protein VSX64_14335 [Aurantimonas sp. C2-6-R+9]|uniref:hypothetical protein n=1 Tax=unclassified Aurantimonas TaxID=2638230 RepID=UPI002E19343F|nr:MULTISPECIES: hypothetical protein [unclassified Aurantimonas]MEC5292582.1 hypothetical protein [Aurantimonas sp. C2-3-R2]MEC5382048.1 hypothetical protein [Aurantimonas sp. C2-6-R+9]MEC5413638.1 hypothetical protein [Aurantimonas sp. C2-4-R8]